MPAKIYIFYHLKLDGINSVGKNRSDKSTCVRRQTAATIDTSVEFSIKRANLFRFIFLIVVRFLLNAIFFRFKNDNLFSSF